MVGGSQPLDSLCDTACSHSGADDVLLPTPVMRRLDFIFAWWTNSNCTGRHQSRCGYHSPGGCSNKHLPASSDRNHDARRMMLIADNTLDDAGLRVLRVLRVMGSGLLPVMGSGHGRRGCSGDAQWLLLYPARGRSFPAGPPFCDG